MNMLLAITQDEAIAAIRRQVSAGSTADPAGLYAWLAGAALLLALLLLVMRLRRGRGAPAHRPQALHDPRKLLRELRQQGVLTRSQIRTFRRQSAQVSRRAGVPITSPLVLALCPSLRRRDQRPG